MQHVCSSSNVSENGSRLQCKHQLEIKFCLNSLFITQKEMCSAGESTSGPMSRVVQG